eukprot:1875463-Amphidinium_carterae.1
MGPQGMSGLPPANQVESDEETIPEHQSPIKVGQDDIEEGGTQHEQTSGPPTVEERIVRAYEAWNQMGSGDMVTWGEHIGRDGKLHSITNQDGSVMPISAEMVSRYSSLSKRSNLPPSASHGPQVPGGTLPQPMISGMASGQMWHPEGYGPGQQQAGGPQLVLSGGMNQGMSFEAVQYGWDADSTLGLGGVSQMGIAPQSAGSGGINPGLGLGGVFSGGGPYPGSNGAQAGGSRGLAPQGSGVGNPGALPPGQGGFGGSGGMGSG